MQVFQHATRGSHTAAGEHGSPPTKIPNTGDKKRKKKHTVKSKMELGQNKELTQITKSNTRSQILGHMQKLEMLGDGKRVLRQN